MKIKPVMTEKSMNDAKKGKYTFLVPLDMSKFKIKETLGEIFSVKVKNVRTQNRKGMIKTTLMRKKMKVKPTKKAVVTLSGKDTIDIFETETKKKGAKKK